MKFVKKISFKESLLNRRLFDFSTDSDTEDEEES
jgi:hypothetical protein